VSFSKVRGWGTGTSKNVRKKLKSPYNSEQKNPSHGFFLERGLFCFFVVYTRTFHGWLGESPLA
jgi:hypothetical protein